MATKPNYLPNWNNVTPVAPLTKKKNETPVLPAVPVKLGTPVMPSVPVKLATPVLPPTSKKNETPVLPGGRVVNKSNYVGDAELVTKQQYRPLTDAEKSRVDAVIAAAPKQFKKDLRLKDRYDTFINGAQSRGYSIREAEKQAALYLYEDIENVRKTGVPSENVIDIVALPNTTELLDHFEGNRTGLRTRFVQSSLPTKVVSNDDLYRTIGEDLKTLDKPGRETYITLLPGWTGTHSELVLAAKSLSRD